jgi:hypothetical protein
VLFIAGLVVAAGIGWFDVCANNTNDDFSNDDSTNSAGSNLDDTSQGGNTSTFDTASDTSGGSCFSGERLWLTVDLDTIKGLSVFIFGYNCQQNSFATQHNELANATPARADGVAAVSVVGATTVYLIVSASGYAAFGPSVGSDVLDSFPSKGGSVLVAAARLGIVGVVLLSYPVRGSHSFSSFIRFILNLIFILHIMFLLRCLVTTLLLIHPFRWCCIPHVSPRGICGRRFSTQGRKRTPSGSAEVRRRFVVLKPRRRCCRPSPHRRCRQSLSCLRYHHRITTTTEEAEEATAG